VNTYLLCEPEEIFRTERYYLRCSYPAPPFCFETPLDFDVNPILAFFKGSYNKVTGMPLPFDLTDQDIAIPTGFTREFVEEIGARLVKDKDLDAYELENHYASLNPQTRIIIVHLNATTNPFEVVPSFSINLRCSPYLRAIPIEIICLLDKICVKFDVQTSKQLESFPS
jgi:hypothetical protein